ncbi:MAG: hypothetical protein LRS48_06740 [Desulfurococcales archaeon]|nr:hypothetical protein [Desulfurococcales archaeon]
MPAHSRRKGRPISEAPWLLPVLVACSNSECDPPDHNMLRKVLRVPGRTAKTLSYYYSKLAPFEEPMCASRSGRLYIAVSRGYLVYAVVRRRSVRGGSIPLRELDSEKEKTGLPWPVRRNYDFIVESIRSCNARRLVSP